MHPKQYFIEEIRTKKQKKKAGNKVRKRIAQLQTYLHPLAVWLTKYYQMRPLISTPLHFEKMKELRPKSLYHKAHNHLKAKPIRKQRQKRYKKIEFSYLFVLNRMHLNYIYIPRFNINLKCQVRRSQLNHKLSTKQNCNYSINYVKCTGLYSFKGNL